MPKLSNVPLKALRCRPAQGPDEDCSAALLGRRAIWATEAQRKSPRSVGANRGRLSEGGILMLGFDGCPGVLEFRKGAALSGNGNCICKGSQVALGFMYPENNRTCQAADV